LVVRIARENSGWGYDRIAEALGHRVSDQTVGNILRRHGIAPSPKRSQNTSWMDFIRSQMAVLAGVNFFTVESAHMAGAGDLLCAVLHSPGEPTREPGGDYQAS
jgi:hypothetical protein